MKKNVAGQAVGSQMITISDGSDFTGTVTVEVTVDSGTKTAGGGTVTHEGEGYHSYAPTQAETNGAHIAFSFAGTGAFSKTEQVWTTFPQTGDSFVRLSDYRLGELMSAALASQPFSTSLLGDLTQDDPDNAGTQQFTTATLNRVWDEVLTGATHNINNSSGKKLRQIAANVFSEGTAQSGGNNAIQLASGAVTIDTQFVRAKIILIGGTGAGQEAIITDSVASTDTLTITPVWLTNPDATTEYEILPAQTHSTVRNGGYDNATVYIDGANGTAGTLVGVNGVTTNPSSNFADARAIADNENIRTFSFSGGSLLALDQSYTNFLFDIIQGQAIDLNGQDVSGSVFMRSAIIGTMTASSRVNFELCGMIDTTLGVCNLLQSGLNGTITLSDTDRYMFWACFENDPTTLPVIDINGDNITKTLLIFNDYSGRATIKNMTSVDVIILSGNCQITLDSTNSGGNISYSGDVKITDNSTVSPTFVTGLTKDILVDTTEIGTAGAGLTDLGGMSTGMKAEVLAEVVKLLVTQMTESYAADGTAPTLAQSLMLIQQTIGDFSITGTTITTKKLDGSSTASTYALNDGTNPTSRTRVT